jgi:hypothetical protein
MSDKRVEKNKQNVENIKKLLLSICNKEKDYSKDKELLKALSSQNGVAKYENKEFNISKSSLNTIKRTAEKIYPNGFEEIDRLRLLALKELNKGDDLGDVKTGTKEYYKSKCKDLQDELEIQREVNLIAIHQIMNEIQVLKNLKHLDNVELIHDLCNKQIEKLQSAALHYSDFAILKKEPNLKLVKDKSNE